MPPYTNISGLMKTAQAYTAPGSFQKELSLGRRFSERELGRQKEVKRKEFEEFIAQMQKQAEGKGGIFRKALGLIPGAQGISLGINWLEGKRRKDKIKGLAGQIGGSDWTRTFLRKGAKAAESDFLAASEAMDPTKNLFQDLLSQFALGELTDKIAPGTEDIDKVVPDDITPEVPGKGVQGKGVQGDIVADNVDVSKNAFTSSKGLFKDIFGKEARESGEGFFGRVKGALGDKDNREQFAALIDYMSEEEEEFGSSPDYYSYM